MVRAELIHNPYLLETDVRFNGCEPKINSLVERYRSVRLQDWINKLPGIFYNEMNGWDFNLDFSGTKMDFYYLQAALDSAGVSRESVCLFHKNELESAAQKEHEISELLSWLGNNPNRNFDFQTFREGNSHLLEDAYSFIVIQDGTQTVAIDGVNVESVSEISDLENSALDNTPILYCINEANCSKLHSNLPKLLKRNDVLPAQVFFNIDPALNGSQVERMICDLGVERPQIVGTASDSVVKVYMEIYPRTVYVQRMIKALRKIGSDTGAVLSAENERSIGINSGIRQKIDELDNSIQRLKNASEQIVHRDNLVPPAGLQSAKDEFMRKVTDWRKRKIKMTSDSEAGGVAVEFEKDLQGYFSEFIGDIEKEFMTAKNGIRSFFAEVYSTAGFEDNYLSARDVSVDLSRYGLPRFLQGFLELKTERMVEQNGNILSGLFKKPSDNTEWVREITYKYEDWRKYAAGQSEPVLYEAIQTLNAALAGFYGMVAEDYLEHLNVLIEKQSKTKSDLVDGFSDDEQKLQEDNDWFASFQEKLLEIERR